MREIAHPGLSFAIRQEVRNPGDHSSSGLGDVIKRVFKRPDSPDGGKEEVQVTAIRPIEERDYSRILEWFSDPETQGHIVPLPQLPEDRTDKDQVDKALYNLHEYFKNLGEPEKITALVAANSKDRPLGSVTIRWRGDPFTPRGHKISSFERLIVNPRIRGRGIGTKLVEASLIEIFEKREYPEVRAWVMTDDIAGKDRGGLNLRFFRKLGFEFLRSDSHSWPEFAKKRGLGENAEGRDGVWLSLKKEDWEKRKAEQQPEQATLELEDV